MKTKKEMLEEFMFKIEAANMSSKDIAVMISSLSPHESPTSNSLTEVVEVLKDALYIVRAREIGI